MSQTVASPPKETILQVDPLVRSARLPKLVGDIYKHRTSYFLLLPFLVPFVIFVAYPIVASAYLSLTEYKGTTAPVFIRFENFQHLLGLDMAVLHPVLDKTTGEPLFKCSGKQVPQSQVSPGSACTAVLQRPSEVLPTGYQEIGRFQFLDQTILMGGSDNRFWIALWNTFVYSAMVVPIGMMMGLALALALQRQTLLNYILRTVFFLPSVTATLAIVVIWKYIFNSGGYGLANGILAQFGVAPISFLADATWTLPVMVIFAVWAGLGYGMILFLAGLQSIPGELYEAAAIDGASPGQRLFDITIPLLRPTLIYVSITGIIGAFQVFDVVYILFSTTEHMGGVLDSGLTIVPYLYEQGFRLFRLGYASSVAWILFLILFVLTIINLRINRANEAY